MARPPLVCVDLVGPESHVRIAVAGSWLTVTEESHRARQTTRVPLTAALLKAVHTLVGTAIQGGGSTKTLHMTGAGTLSYSTPSGAGSVVIGDGVEVPQSIYELIDLLGDVGETPSRI